MIRGTLKILGWLARVIQLFVLMTAAILLSLYIAAGVALNGDWDKVDNAVAKAYKEFVK